MYFRRIRDLREDQDYTQLFVAKHLNMQRSVYRRYESGEREIPVWALIKLSRLYRVSTDYILGLTVFPWYDLFDPPKWVCYYIVSLPNGTIFQGWLTCISSVWKTCARITT